MRSSASIQIEAYEAEDFATAIAGLDVEYLRTGGGSEPCRMTVVDQPEAQLSIGSMGFSAISRSEVPSEVGVFALITAAPPGGRYCGVDLAAGQLFFYAPGTSFVGVESAGLEACMLTVPTASLELAAEGFVDTAMLRSVTALSPSPEVEQLGSLLRSAIKRPTDLPGEHVVEAAAGVLATDSTPRRSRVGRRLGSHTIVVRSIEYAERTQTNQPTVGDLCRASGASASRLRQAFVDVFDLPPTKYFQYRLLSALRDELALAGPTTQSVTGILSSLGVTEFGRISGRYKNAFGELPSATLRRLPSND